MIGREISHYKIVEEIGKGGMGVVYKGFDTHLKRYAAIKILPEKFAKDKERKARFFQEALAASKVSHPNIAHIYDIGEEGDVSFIAMEYVEGKSLRQVLKEDTLSLPDALTIGHQVAEALSKAHESGVIHRDIKPENIMLTNDGYAKILDFGLAKFAGTFGIPFDDEEAETFAEAKTMEGAIMGTVAYMSPEQATGRPLDFRTDIFSFGLVLYEMVTGKGAFEGKSNIQILHDIIEKPLRSLAELAQVPAGLPADLDRLMKKSTEKNPSDRYTSTAELASDLKTILKEVESGVFVQVTPPGIAARLKSLVEGKNFYMLIVVIGLILIAFASYFVGTKWKLGGIKKPSIAVVYFQNLSPNREADAYFRDGMTEDIITELSKLKGITVLLRDAVAPYKDKIVGPKKLKEEIGADFVLDGSIQKVEDKLKINAQLIQTDTGSTLWANDFATDLKNVFEVQSDISRQIATALKIKVTKEDEERLEKKGTTNIEAYKNYLQGKGFSDKLTKNNIEPAIKFFEKAIELDPNYSLAYSALSKTYSAMYDYSFDQDEVWLDRAEAAARKAIDLDPESSEAHAALAEAFRIERFLDEALKEMEKEATLRPESEDFLTSFHNSLGLIYFKKGNKDKAVEQFQASISFNRPSSWMAYANLANALRDKGKFDEALKDADTAIQIHPDHEQPYREKAKILMDQKNYAEADKLLKKSIQIAPENISAYEELMKLYKMENRYDEAAVMMRRFIDEYPYNRGGYNALKGIYDAMGKADEGIRIMEEAVRRNPDKVWAYQRLGVVYYRLRKFNEALDIFQRGLKIRNDYRLINNIGSCYQEMGDNENARRSFEEAIKINPSHSPSYMNLGKLYETLEQYDLAEKYLRKAIAIKSDIEDYYWELRKVLRMVGREKEIVSLLEDALREHSDNRVLLNTLGGVYFDLNDYENAVKNFEKAIDINPQSELYLNLGWSFMNMERFPEAESAFTKALDLKPDYDEAHLQMDLLQLYKNNVQESEKMLKEDAARFPKNPKFLEWLGIIDAFQGRCQDAEANFKKAEELDPFSVRCGTLSICYRNILNSVRAEEMLGRSQDRALAILKKKSDEIPALAGLMQCTALKGKESEALKIADKLSKLDPMKRNYFIASVYSLLGKHDLALKHLKMAKDDGLRNFIEWKWDINLLPLRNDPEFQKLMNRS